MSKKIAIPFFAFVLSAFAYNTQAQTEIIEQKVIVEEAPLSIASVDYFESSDIDTTNIDTRLVIARDDSQSPVTEKSRDGKKPYTSVEQMPRYTEGDMAMIKFIANNLVYPKIAVENEIQGRVTVRFVVTKNGSLKDIEVLKSLDPSCDKEAVRIIESMPNWIPGKTSQGEVVDVYFILPIVFRLN